MSGYCIGQSSSGMLALKVWFMHQEHEYLKAQTGSLSQKYKFSSPSPDHWVRNSGSGAQQYVLWQALQPILMHMLQFLNLPSKEDKENI